MENLQYASKETQEHINAVMESPSVSFFTKQIIRDGLQKDCLDAVNYVQLAVDALKRVQDDIIA
jgi:hypothetical protein